MKILLDTHTFLWYIQDNQRLSVKVAELLENSTHNLYFSIVSLWEIAIKVGKGKLILDNSFDELQEILGQLKIENLPVTFADTKIYIDLPSHHGDPFDRMLIAQAMNYSLIVVSRDSAFDAYPIQRLWD
jgi:PIN domain nuclease of toxin-antitoxin system